MKKILRALAAALTSPEAVKEEKQLATLVLARLGITSGAIFATVEGILKATGH